MFSQAQNNPVLSELESLEWKNRVVIINDSSNEEESLRALSMQLAEINDRDIIWLILNGDLVTTNYSGSLSPELVGNIRARLGSIEDKVILIGKDGGVKSRYDDLDIDTIFSEIDAMPMRQLEMQN